MAGREGPQEYHSVPVSLVIILFGGVVLFIAWFANHRGLTTAWLWMDWAMLQPIKYTVGLFSDYSVLLSAEVQNKVTEQLYCPKETNDPNATDFGTTVECYNFKQNWKLGWWVSNAVGSYYRWPLLLLIGYLIYKIWSRPLKKYSGSLSVTDFLLSQSKNWKTIVPFLDKKLIGNMDEDYRPSRDAVDVAEMNRVVIEKNFLEAEAKQVLKRQLGEKISKDAMDEVHKALFTCFALRIKRKPKETSRLFNEINESMRGNKPPMLSEAVSKFDELYGDSEIQQRIKGHQYISTALFELLVAACEQDGVLAPAEFVAWVKPRHRSLWYALNRAPADHRLEIASFSEGLQIVCQWQAERVAKIENLELQEIFYDRSILAWKDALYSLGAIDDPVENINASSLAAKKKEKETMTQTRTFRRPM